ncbi:MAG: prolyl oligopeptidase family serine peptidase [Lactimicrobium massiliense]|nr:prolyl oligopeptidase family serine peptidase [Lactimicrobium massiliense]MDD6675442.1 prolyl oligopeptidase family serine peptidase [Lactimicrobium massiliense]
MLQKMKHFLAMLFSVALLFSGGLTPVMAQESPASYAVTFMGNVTDAGQCVSGMRIDFGQDVTKVEGIDHNTFTVNFTDTVAVGANKDEAYAYVDASKPLPVVKTEVNGSVVTVYFQLNALPTLNWLAEGRNYPANLTLSVKQNNAITLTKTTETPDKRTLEETSVLDTDTVYTNSVSSWKDLEDAETAKFTSVQDTVNYQYHEGSNKALIVWFHGNGEGDLEGNRTNNNVAQMLGNRGTVAWVSDEAQSVFGNATVMAFQSPDTWYYAVKNDYLDDVKAEIDKVVSAKGIDANEMYVAGCSAGGYMTTRMLIAYPDLFKAAMINCPALDLASARNITSGTVTQDVLNQAASVTGGTPSDAELARLKNSRTAIWLVQGETDSSVNPENCSKRIWKFLSDGESVTSKEYAGMDGIGSGFTTYETTDHKYKLSLYQTVDQEDKTGTLLDTRKMGKIVVSEDYDLDGQKEAVKYNDHWTWIYTLRNNPDSADGHIWNWAKNYAALPTIGGSQKVIVTGDDWGPGVSKTIVHLDQEASSVSDAAVTEIKENTDWTSPTFNAVTSSAARTVLKTYLCDADGNEVQNPSSYAAVEMYISPSEGSPFRYDVTAGSNKWCDPYELDVSASAVLKDGTPAKISSHAAINFRDYTQWKSEPAMQFDVSKKYTENSITIPYGEWKPAADDHKNPLVIWLHGAGEGVSKYKNDVYVDLLGNEVTSLISDEFQQKMNGAYVITPQAQTMWMDGGDGNYQSGDKGSMYEETLFDLIQSYVKSNPDIDPNRIIVGGCSNGGYMTMELILKHPDYFYKAYPICEAYADEFITDEQIRDLAESRMGIWFTYSRDDTTVDPTKHAIPTIERLKQAGADVHVSSYDHVVDTTGRFTNADGTPYQYMGHWSWIYFDNNVNVDDETGENEWDWLANNKDPVYTVDAVTDVHQLKTNSALNFEAKMLVDKFVGVSVDGKPLASDDYTAEKGSVLITLKAEYLNTLSAGEHTLTVYARDGSGTKTFTITEKGKSNNTAENNKTDSKTTDKKAGKTSTKTGVNTDVTGYVILLCAAVIIIAAAVRKLRKNN